MKKKIIVCIIMAMFLFSCNSINSSEAIQKESSGNSSAQDKNQSLQAISDSSSAQEETQSETSSILETVLDTKYPIEAINIDKIENAAIINVAWKDKENIYFIAQTYPYEINSVKSEPVDFMKYPIEVYHYNVRNNSLDKVYEYFSDNSYTYLYIQVQDTGDLVLKHDDGFIIVSGKDYKVIKDIQMPKDVHYINYNLSYDGTKIATAYVKEKQLKILDSSTMEVIQTVKIPDAGYIQAPTWTMNSSNILLFAPEFEFVNVVYVYNTVQNKLSKFDFSDNIDTYDNEAYLANEAKSVFRMDNINNNDNKSVKVLIERYDLDTAKSNTWSFDAEVAPYCKSISEKGLLVGHVYTDYHYLIIADLNGQKVIKTEKARSGGGMYPPKWARDQEQAIALFTVEGRGDATSKWAAAIIDAKKIINGEDN